MQLNPYLLFEGQCEAAFRFYEQCLGGKIEELTTFGDSPMAASTAADWRDKVMHARMIVDGHMLMGSDPPPSHFKRAEGFWVSLQFDNAAEAERIFNALAENGEVTMALQETFWAARFGMVRDRFGVPWIVDCEKAA